MNDKHFPDPKKARVGGPRTSAMPETRNQTRNRVSSHSKSQVVDEPKV
jgi:hypothetical protein